MRFSTSALVLGTLAAGHASAASIGHEGHAGKRHNHAARHSDLLKKNAENMEKRSADLINAAGLAQLSKLSVNKGTNNVAASGLLAWAGSDGPFTSEFINASGEDLILAVWGPSGSWVNAVPPHLTISIAKDASQNVSFPINWSGAWAPIYSGTQMRNGQIMDTWGEATFRPPHSVFDVSREVNMKGRSMSIVGPACTSDMNTCVFKCGSEAEEQCMYGYQLVNCATGSQKGAYFGFDNGAASGGCGGLGSTDHIKTYLGSNGPADKGTAASSSAAAVSPAPTQWGNY